MFGIWNKNFKIVSINLTCSLVIIDGILRDFALSTFRIFVNSLVRWNPIFEKRT